jgi:DNA-binding NtrC family response regulator
MVLRVNHFEVVEAASAAEGMRAFGDAHFDVAIVDIFLDESNGLDLIARMRELAPDLPVVAVSGMAAFDGVAMSDDLARVVYLQKPFRPAELVRAVADARAAVQASQVAGAGT